MGDAYRDTMRDEWEAKKQALARTLEAAQFERHMDLSAPTDNDLSALLRQMEFDGWSWYPPRRRGTT